VAARIIRLIVRRPSGPTGKPAITLAGFRSAPCQVAMRIRHWSKGSAVFDGDAPRCNDSASQAASDMEPGAFSHVAVFFGSEPSGNERGIAMRIGGVAKWANRLQGERLERRRRCPAPARGQAR
ncbi:MAG: hypothetical protein ACK56I_01365, partial [bacterium]